MMYSWENYLFRNRNHSFQEWKCSPWGLFEFPFIPRMVGFCTQPSIPRMIWFCASVAHALHSRNDNEKGKFIPRIWTCVHLNQARGAPPNTHTQHTSSHKLRRWPAMDPTLHENCTIPRMKCMWHNCTKSNHSWDEGLNSKSHHSKNEWELAHAP